MSLLPLLYERLLLDEVRRIARTAALPGNEGMAAEMFTLISSADNRVAQNALWVLTYLQPHIPQWFEAKREELIDGALKETDPSKLRMWMKLLSGLRFKTETIRPDFLDFCLSLTTSATCPCAIRARAMKMAADLSRHYPELRAEVIIVLDLLGEEPLSPGLVSARRQALGLLYR